jgi:hypothetical protein
MCIADSLWDATLHILVPLFLPGPRSSGWLACHSAWRAPLLSPASINHGPNVDRLTVCGSLGMSQRHVQRHSTYHVVDAIHLQRRATTRPGTCLEFRSEGPNDISKPRVGGVGNIPGGFEDLCLVRP